MSLLRSVLFLVLVFVPSITMAQMSTLSLNYYQKTCPDFSKIVRDTVTAKQKEKSNTAAGTLRLFFHDCFMEGCDASVLIAANPANKTERDDELNQNLPLSGFNTVNLVKTALEKSCPGVVSCADILAQSTRDLVTLVGGPTYEVKLGRKDGFESKVDKVKENLPQVRQSVPDMLAIFKKKGFTLKELVALSGGHTIGIAHCKEFSDRIFGPQVDPELNPKYAGTLKNMCKDYKTNRNQLANLDSVTPKQFDNMYFKNLKLGLGLLASDHILFKDMSTRPIVELYANNQEVFFQDFARAMEKLSMVGVKGEKDGEVRRKCDQFNSANAKVALRPK